MWYRTEGNTIHEGPIALPNLWLSGEVQYPLREMDAKGHSSEVIDLGWLPEIIIETAKSETQKVVGYTPVVAGRAVRAVENIRPKTGAEIADDTARANIAADRALVSNDAAVQLIIGKRPSEIETYIDDNVTDLDDVKTILKSYGKVLSILARRL